MTANGKKVLLVKGCAWALKLLGIFTGVVNKAFGSLSYDRDLSIYKENYIVADLKESIKRTEDI